MRILVLGLNPSRKLGKSPTLKVLYSWLDQLHIGIVSFDNIYHGFESFSLKNVKGNYIREISKDYDRIIALGNKVSDILELMGIDHFKLPHPSGLNRKLNNLIYVDKMLSECTKYLQGEAYEIL